MSRHVAGSEYWGWMEEKAWLEGLGARLRARVVTAVGMRKAGFMGEPIDEAWRERYRALVTKVEQRAR